MYGRPSLFIALGLMGLAASAGATTVGPQTSLATPAAAQRAPAVSWDPVAMVYLLVWEDARNAANGVDLYAARINPDGSLADALGVPVLTGVEVANDETQPALVYNPAGNHVLAWTEARTGFNDIFAARITVGSGLTVIPSTGIQLTAGNDSESAPVVAPATNSVLFGWQVNLVGGGTRARGRRYNLNLSVLDAASFDLSTAGNSGTPVLLGIGNTFQAVWEDPVGDLYGRSLPDTGTLPAVPTIVPIVTATRTQSAAAITRLGLGNVVVFWEDQRDVADRDVFARRYTATLAPIGAERVVYGGAFDQRQPVAAGDDNGALVIWQDRRNGAANFPTYAARLDSSGNVRDPNGFAVLVYNANSTEHALAKGPGSDWLVASVGGVGVNARINYRIVRDEVPAGVMPATGPASVPADGSSTASIVFSPAVGASGLSVVDGTLYTVTLSSPNVTLSAPDADPITPGRQVMAFNGSVGLQLSSLAHGAVTVSLASVEGSATGQTGINFANVPPVASAPVVGPPAPTSSDDLLLSYSYSDINGDAEGTSAITWTRNSGVESAYTNLRTVPFSATRKNDQWRASVRPYDGLDSGAQVFSNTVVIGNSAPICVDPHISPDRDVRTGTALVLRYNFQDQDGDPEGATLIRWYDRGAEQAPLTGRTSLLAATVIKGQVWQARITPHDGTETGPEVASATVAVINSAPVADAGANGSVIERRRYSLNGSASSDRDPQDSLQFSWQQVIVGSEPNVPLSSSSSSAPFFDAPSVTGTTFLNFELSVSDGDENSALADRVTIEVTPVPDQDRDGLDDEEEALAGTDPATADSDRDGLLDGEEVAAGTGPLDEDSDDDGVRDGAEGQSARNATDAMPFADADGDTIVNARDPDADGDGITDGTELSILDALPGGGSAPFVYEGTAMAAGFFLADADPTSGTNPNLGDTDLDTFLDGVEDANHNGRIDSGESDPNDPTSPGLSCSASTPCPTGLHCEAGSCLPGPGADAGLSCTKLAATVECCTACTGGRKLEPVCTQNGVPESCPIGGMLCNAGACDVPPAVCPDGSTGCEGTGCGCNSAPARRTSPAGLFALCAVAFLARRRFSPLLGP